MYMYGVGSTGNTPDPANLFGKSNEIMGKDEFLKLLVTQLQNQDPLDPKGNEEYVAQLAQFSSLEQMQNMNATLQSNGTLTQSVNNALTAGLIGKEIKALGNEVVLSGTGPVNLSIGLTEKATATITIKDSSGKIVRVLKDQELKAGSNEVSWDGKNETGQRVGDGNYTYSIEAKNAAGKAVQSEGYFTGVVTGVKFIGGQPVLLVGDREIPMGGVLQIRQPGSTAGA